MAAAVQPKTKTSSRSLCAAASNSQNEPLAATASRIDHWLLVEYRGRWGRDVLGDSLLSPELKAHLRAQLAELGHARLLFVKQPGHRAREARRVFLSRSRPGDERLVQLEVAHHEDLRELDLASVLTTDGGVTTVDGPLFVVCTHGKRDRCCAKFGRPLYDAVREQAEDGWVWQSSHVGGDRFAGNLVALPSGVFLGRVEPGDAWHALDELLAGRVPLERYRGRSCHSFPVQAAERAVREATGLMGVDELRLVESVRDRDGWRVRFEAAGERWEVRVERREGPLTYLTCSADVLSHPRHYAAGILRESAA